MTVTKKLLICLLAVWLASVTGCGKKNENQNDNQKPVTLKVGHVGHDHHLALFVAADNGGEYEKQTGCKLTCIRERQLYKLHKNGKLIAQVEFVRVGGGSKMPTALAQNVIEIGFGGVVPVLAAVDSGSPIRMIAPLHYKGDMFVVRNDMPVKTWADFVEYAKQSDKPLRIGYKSPLAVAKLIFEKALEQQELTYSSNPAEANADIIMVNTKGGAKLNVALAGSLIDGYAGNNPFPAIAEQKQIGKVIVDLEEISPELFRDHPCCCIAARTDTLQSKSQAVTALLSLWQEATATINSDRDNAIASAVNWIGTSEQIERKSIATSGYSMNPTQQWHRTMQAWIKVLNEMGTFNGILRELDYESVRAKAYDFGSLQKIHR